MAYHWDEMALRSIIITRFVARHREGHIGPWKVTPMHHDICTYLRAMPEVVRNKYSFTTPSIITVRYVMTLDGHRTFTRSYDSDDIEQWTLDPSDVEAQQYHTDSSPVPRKAFWTRGEGRTALNNLIIHTFMAHHGFLHQRDLIPKIQELIWEHPPWLSDDYIPEVPDIRVISNTFQELRDTPDTFIMEIWEGVAAFKLAQPSEPSSP